MNLLETLRKDLIIVEDVTRLLEKITDKHPDHPEYISEWTKYSQRSIEGMWIRDFNEFRFVPPTLYYYSNFFRILHVDTAKKVRKYIPPYIRDLDWAIHYAYMTAQGFSGFEHDDEYTCDRKWFEYNQHGLPDMTALDPYTRSNILHMVNSKGRLKKYMGAYSYLKNRHPRDMGKPLYINPAKNLQIFGSRGGGKTYTVTGIESQILTFDGLKYFTKEGFMDNPPTAHICIGSGNTDQSSEHVSKLMDGLNAHGTDKTLGVWGNTTDPDHTPTPFFRDFIGSTLPGNKKNYFRYEYEVETPTGWKTMGTKTGMYHVNYSDKKQGGAQAAAGGRYLLVTYEEIGLMPNFIDALQSNIGVVTGDSEQFGVQLGLGTSGNIELVQQAKKVFTNPEEYNFLSFPNIWENEEEKIGMFIPAYLVDMRFKDANGNTDIDRAMQHYMKRREEAASKSDPKILDNEKMNYPLIPSDMWIGTKGSYFPVNELLEREKQLLKGGYYKTASRPIKLFWDTSTTEGIRAENDTDCEPFYFFPYHRTMTSISGAILEYEPPRFINGKIPEDMYIFVLDPYLADNISEGGSLGALYGFINPKYEEYGHHKMVCSYIGKHEYGKDAYYGNVEKILHYYGNPKNGLWYEANAGDSVRGYFLRKNKTHLLCFRPDREIGSSAFSKRVQDYGIMLGQGNASKLRLISDAAEFLLTKVNVKGKEMRYVETLDDLFLIQQLLAFEIKKHKNFDAVSAFIIYPLVVKELEHIIEHEQRKKTKGNALSFLSLNPNIFGHNIRNEKNHRPDR